VVDSHKIEELIVHLGQHPRVVDLGPTKLWKLIYFIDARALRDLGVPVTGSEFIKYEHGPVPSRGEKHLKKLLRSETVTSTGRIVGGKTLNELKSHRQPNLSVFSPEECEIVESVCAELGRKTASALSQLSHNEPAWHYAKMRGKLSPELVAYGQQEDSDGL